MTFDLTVCLPPDARAHLDEAIQAVLAAHHGEWDRWHVQGHLLARPEYADDPALVHNPVYANGDPRPRRPPHCDGGPKRMLDHPAMRASAVAAARARWRVWRALVRRHPPAEPLSVLMARHPDRDAARRAHLAQPLVQDVARRAAHGAALLAPFLAEDPVAHFGRSERDYLDRAAADAIRTVALVTLDGSWVDEYGMADLPAYRHFFTGYLDRLDGDALVVELVCHC
jgi:hypothetical protein